MAQRDTEAELGETAGCLRCGDATNTHTTNGCTRRLPCKPCDESDDE